ncbi:hypothetical protein WJX84_003280 [Apatococcus fuscideae]|uniref:TOG domain-containing protein n=1 Tax=Apatococcus fuscideae TaxID=2026836 RepID=A0AAW1SYD7_9CHLO
MTPGQGQKLSFEIQDCTGQDPGFPAEELIQHGHPARGWQTPRKCQFPVSLTLRLYQPARIHQIQILSHEFKIATRVEIFTGNLPPGNRDAESCAWKRLGFLSFDKNERSGYQARELKSVHVNTSAYLLKLVVQRCHPNKLNTDNQVGLIALNLTGVGIGWPEARPSAPSQQQQQQQQQQQHQDHSSEHDDSRASPDHPPGMPLGVHQNGVPRPSQKQPCHGHGRELDPVTAGQLREIQQQKAAAVAREDYDEAKRLKQAGDRLQAMGSEIAGLEARKRAAVDQEDYDTAKALKGQIERMRSAGMAPMCMDEGLENKPRRANNPDGIIARAGQGGKGIVAAGHLQMPDPMSPPAHIPPRRQTSRHYSRDASPDPLDEPPVGSLDAGAMEDQSRTPAQAYDERPARGGGTYEDGAPNGADVPSIARRLNPDSPEGAATPSPQLPEGFPSDLPAPEPFSAADAKDADDLVELVGEYTARSFYSRIWQLREAALLRMQRLLEEPDSIPADRKKEAFRTLAQALLRSVRDKVANVFHTTLEVVQSLLEGLAGSVGQREVATLTAELIPILIDTTGSTNARMAAAASENLLHLAGIRDVGLAAMAPLFVRPVRNQNAWRPVLGRLQLISQLLPQLGIARGGNGEGFELAGLMRFVGQAFGSPNADVRSLAIKVAAQVHAVVGAAMQSHLPEGLNPKMKSQLDEACGGPKALPVVPQQSVPPAQARGSNKQASMPRQGSGPPAHAKQKAGQAAAASGGPTHSSAVSGLHSPLRPPHVKVPAAASDAGSPSPVASPDASAAALNEDPAPFEAELAAREKALGADHVDVAESLSNLAILYNQKGEMGKALPLYERALRIWEAQKGPEHPEVAHTLTDLAVLHLEQGHDELGRPLLERALAIQEKALGPEHPDVMAIRDVLNSEDD